MCEAIKGLFQRAVFFELCRRAFEDHATVMQKDNVVCDRLDFLKDVRRDEDSLPAYEIPDVLTELPDLVRVEPRGGLVHNEHLRIV